MEGPFHRTSLARRCATFTMASCLALGMSLAGCNSGKPLELELSADVELKNEKSASTTIKVKQGKIDSVVVKPDDRGVGVKKDGDQSATVWVEDAGSISEDGRYQVTITGKGYDGKTKELVVAVKVARDDKLLEKLYKESQDNLKQIILAIHTYHDNYRRIPPAAICSDEHEEPLLSWRVLILPHLGEEKLFDEFKLKEPWNSPHNSKLLPRMPKVFGPVGSKKTEPNTTFYQVFAREFDPNNDAGALSPMSYLRPGVGFPFPGAACQFTLGNMPDGTSNVLGVVEAGEPVPWTKPTMLGYDPKKPLPKLGGQFPGRMHVALMDGTVRSYKLAPPGVDSFDASRRGELSERTLREAILCNTYNQRPPDW